MYKQTKGKIRRTGAVFGRSFMALALTASMTVLPAAAGADEAMETTDAASDAVAQWAEANETSNQGNYSPYSYVSDDPLAQQVDGTATQSADGEASDTASTTYPESYDLRTLGVVTPVKDQTPWGTCWGFASIAASETSILSEAGTTYEKTGLDLSERALAWLVYDPVPESEGSQAGEGAHFTDSETDPNSRLEVGGYMVYATTLFSSGTGLLYEDLAPYKNDESIIRCRVTMAGASKRIVMTLTADEISALEVAGATVTKLNYAKTITQVDTSTGQILSETPATWKVSDEYWGSSAYELEESSILPEYRILNYEGEYTGTSTEAINATKSELMAGRAVSIGFAADQAMPGRPSKELYLDTTHWAHYTYETAAADHAVTIVGWDDSYSKENFGGGDASKQPAADGAWIVKNSWGAETEDFPNHYNWGIVNEDEQHTGYFYLSYYDKSISMPESFNYDLNSYSESDEYLLYQYDFLVSNQSPVTLKYDSPAPEANVFTAERKSVVRSFGCQTTRPNTQVTYEMYLLNDNASNPQDGTLVASTTATYEYGGYHRVTLDEADRVNVKEGEKFSVVVTQYCLDDGKYYQSATKNYGAYTQEEIYDLRKQKTEYYEKTYYSEKYDEVLKDYLAQGLSQEEAEKRAAEDANAYVKLESTQAEISKKVEADIASATQIEYEAVVNEGESYSFVANAGTGSWVDWSVVVDSMEAASEQHEIYDNFPVKAYAEIDTSTGTVDRLSGDTRYDTMASIAQAGFTEGNVAVLATGDNFPDALVASSIAGVDNAPVLLTETNSLSEQTKAEIKRLGVDAIIVLGGTASVSDEVLAEIDALGTEMGKTINVGRVSGEDRAATSLEAMNLLKESELAGDFDTVIIASGKTRDGVYGDALSVSPYAYAKKAPILLTDDEGNLTEDEIAAIKANDNIMDIVIVGGGDSVGGAEAALSGYGYYITRLDGEDRYSTSALVADWELDLDQGMKATDAAIVTGQNFPDALSGAALSGAKKSILLLADDTNSAEAVTVLETKKGRVETLYVYGGEDSVSDAVKDTCATAAGIKE